MTVYVDELVYYPGKGYWCHMASPDLEELHALAGQIGLRREWFQAHARHPHYDLMPFARALAVEHGAVAVSIRELVRILKNGAAT